MHQVTNPRPRRTDMLAASHLILVSILAPSWSLADHGSANARPASVPKSRLCPSGSSGHAVDFPTRCIALSVHRMGVPASRFSVGQSCLFVPSRRHHQTRSLGSESEGSRGEAPASYILRQIRAKRGFVRTGCLLALIPFSTQFAHDAEASCSINLQGGFQS